ncbi:MAG: hypothetical protein ACRDY0_03665 [Acidimicrobiales bacterium]
MTILERSHDKSVPTLVTELKDLVVAYAKQETLDPLKALGRFVLWGAIGAVLLSIGAVLLALAVVRLLQTEAGAHLSGDLSWVPYSGGILLAVLVAGAAASRIAKLPR